MDAEGPPDTLPPPADVAGGAAAVGAPKCPCCGAQSAPDNPPARAPGDFAKGKDGTIYSWTGSSWRALGAAPAEGEISSDGAFSWSTKRAKWRQLGSKSRLPKSYLWIVLPIVLLVLGVAAGSIALPLAGRGDLPAVVVGLASAGLGGLIGLFAQSPTGVQTSPGGPPAGGAQPPPASA